MANRAYHHLYNRAAWRSLRASQLSAEPLCRMHRAIGQLVEGRVVDHITPHRGDLGLFYAADNLQTLCKACHDGHKQAQEHHADGLLRGAGHDGLPLDLAHPWHRPPAAMTASPVDSRRAPVRSHPEPAAARLTPPAPPAPPQSGQGGGVSKPGTDATKTAWLPSFAGCQNSEGGLSA